MKYSFYTLHLCLLSIGLVACGSSSPSIEHVQTAQSDTVTTEGTPQWQSLADNNSLSQWKIVGGSSTYTINEQTITGTSVADKKSTYLISNNIYTDFIFETDIKVDEPMNSGVQFRSNIHSKGYVYGYQMEIDTSTRAWSGGIYDQSRRGWIYNLTRNGACQKEFKIDGWNSYRIEAIGNTVKTFINKVPCSHIIDDLSPSGFIALQVHSAGKDKNGKQVQWRNPKINTFEPQKHVLAVPKSKVPLVFNYIDNHISEYEEQQGWSLVPLAAKDNSLTNKKNLVIDNPYTSFELELDIKVYENSKAGIHYLSTPKIDGLTFTLVDNELIGKAPNTVHSFGAIENLVAPSNISEPTFRNMRFNKNGQWNRARIVVQKTNKMQFHIEHWMNNIKIAQYNLKLNNIEHSNAISKLITISIEQGKIDTRNLKLKALPNMGIDSKKKNPGDRKGHVMTKVVPEAVIPPAPILSINEALDAFRVHDDFEIEVVAKEPLIFDPVVAIYDAAGRIWAAEMTTFMQDTEATGEMAPESQIVVLTDTNNDGEMDKRQVVIDNIMLPRALAFVPKGIIWADHVQLYFSELYEENGEFSVINTDVVDSTYAKGGNLEHKPNGLLYSLDNWYYNAKSNNRYRPIPLNAAIPSDAKEIYRNKHWKMLKAKTEFRGQWGISQDDYGRHYFNNNSSPLHTTSFLPNVTNRLPQHKFSTQLNQQKLGTSKVFPIRVTPGLNRGYNKDMYNDDYKLKSHTAACGPLVYRGNQFPKKYYGIALAQEPAGNLVKATKLTEINGIVQGEDLFNQQEILASTDERFRPVSAINAPDGTITLIDFYHGILQHRAFLTTYLSEQIKSRDLERHKHIGRLYRIKHKNAPIENVTYLDKLSATQLIPYLAHDNGWHRDTAQQLIVMKQDKSVISALKIMATSHSNHLAQIKALWALEGLNAIDFNVLSTATQLQQNNKAFNSKIKRSVYRLSEQLALTPQIKQWIKTEAKVANSETVNALLLTAGTHKDFETISSLTNTFGVNDFTIAGIGPNYDTFIKEQNKTLDKAHSTHLKSLFESMNKNTVKNKMTKKLLASFKRGKTLFEGEAGCFGCHGADGEGTSIIPPLNQSKWVTQSPERLAAILLRGLAGPITVKNKYYQAAMTMPGLANNHEIKDADLADIANYIRNAWQNSSPKITEEQFKTVRNRTKAQHIPFTEKTLKQANF